MKRRGGSKQAREGETGGESGVEEEEGNERPTTKLSTTNNC